VFAHLTILCSQKEHYLESHSKEKKYCSKDSPQLAKLAIAQNLWLFFYQNYFFFQKIEIADYSNSSAILIFC
jgi:hypothetical protein